MLLLAVTDVACCYGWVLGSYVIVRNGGMLQVQHKGEV